MRGLFSTLVLILAIAAILVVIAHSAAEAYLRVSDNEPDLNTGLLLTNAVPAGWQASALTGVDFDEAVVTPCLRTPLLEGVGLRNRGAMEFARRPGSGAGVDLLLLQTSSGSARAIMDDVVRDTENDCQRGVTVGTVSNASVESIDLPHADQALLASYDQETPSLPRSKHTVVLQQDQYVALLDYEVTEGSRIADDDLAELAAAVSERIDDPPTEAEYIAAGVNTGPTQAEEFALRVQDQTSQFFTLSGRLPLTMGMAALSGVVALMFIIGVRMSQSQGGLVSEGGRRPIAEPRVALDQHQSTTEGFGDKPASGRSLRSTRVGSEAAQPTYDEPDEPPDDPEPAPAAPPPVVDFPQKSIEEKLSILKEARLKEPRREHRAVREMQPDVNWTDEISKAESADASKPADPVEGPVNPKTLLKKLRSTESEA